MNMLKYTYGERFYGENIDYQVKLYYYSKIFGFFAIKIERFFKFSDTQTNLIKKIPEIITM